MRIAILMSTFNGEKYIEEQLASIFSQYNVSYDLFIRDDCSEDSTIEILNKYKKNYSNIHIIQGDKNIGALRSYEFLINKVPDKYDYYAFADQDDVWYKDKLNVAIKKLNNVDSDLPALYICNQNCVNEKGEFIYLRFPEFFIQANIINTMLDNHYSGCSMVLNQKLMYKVKNTYKKAGKSLRVLYDVWILAIAQAIGKVIYDKTPYLDYRRHSGTVTQASLGNNYTVCEIVKKFFNMIITLKNYSYYKGYTRYRCMLLLDCFREYMNDPDITNLNILATYCDGFSKWILMLIYNPLYEFYPKPKIFTWLRFFICIY